MLLTLRNSQHFHYYSINFCFFKSFLPKSSNCFLNSSYFQIPMLWYFLNSIIFSCLYSNLLRYFSTPNHNIPPLHTNISTFLLNWPVETIFSLLNSRLLAIHPHVYQGKQIIDLITNCLNNFIFLDLERFLYIT